LSLSIEGSFVGDNALGATIGGADHSLTAACY